MEARDQIAAALKALHGGKSTDSDRRNAQDFLLSIKQNEDAPLWGFHLASNNENDSIVRHYGLSLLEHSVQYSFHTYDSAKKVAVKDWLVELAFQVGTSNHPNFVLEKIACIWVSIAKREWGELWVDMDELLYKLWCGHGLNSSDGSSNQVSQEFTLLVFRNLFEDIYLLDDPIAAKRSSALTAQSIEVVCSDSILEEVYETRVLKSLRYGPDGWLLRWADLLNHALQDGNESLCVKILEALKTCLAWVFSSAIHAANILGLLSTAVQVNNIKVRLLATDCLNVLFTRQYSQDEDFDGIVGTVFKPAGILALTNVYKDVCSQIDVDDLDDEAYLCVKRIVDLLVVLGEFIGKVSVYAETDTVGYLALLLETTKNPSLQVSGQSLPLWCSILRQDSLGNVLEIILPQLLETAVERCVKYDDVNEDHISVKFLEIDVDSKPEKQAFSSNYRKYMEDVIRLSVCRIPFQAFEWINGQLAEHFNAYWNDLQQPIEKHEGNPFYFLSYSKLLVVESALRGVSRWRVWYNQPDKTEMDRQIVESVTRCGESLLGMNIEDPLLLRKQVQCLVQFATMLKSQQLIFKILEKVISACTKELSESASDEDRELIRDLHASCGTELNRLAYLIPDMLMNIYDDLERVINEIVQSKKLSDHENVSFLSFLLVVSQRSSVPQEKKEEKFASIVDPILSSWTDESTVKGLMDLHWFMERIGIIEIAKYFRSRGVTENTNLLETAMDDTGRALKEELRRHWQQLFPIRATRIFIQYTIERLDHSSPEFLHLLKLWKPRIQPILSHVLQLIAQIQAYLNPANWASLPVEVQSFVKYTCQERFWQLGVSTQTREEFFEDNVKAMHTLRDFADSVGHIIRYTREYAFLALGSISQLEETMFEMPDIANNLWNALAGDSVGITTHSWRHMISLVIRNVVKNCPRELISGFMPTFLSNVLRKLDEVLVDKWNEIYSSGLRIPSSVAEREYDLSEEMMDEHLLRQLTAIVDRLLIDLVGQLGNKSHIENPELINVVLNNDTVLAPFLTLCCHILNFKDNRCSFNCCLIIRNVLPKILLRSDDIDRFVGNEMASSCLRILSDESFSDVHNEAAYTLTSIYTILRSKHEWPFDVLCTLLPNVSQAEVSDFESRLSSPTSLRQQRGVFIEFLTIVQLMPSESDREAQRKKAEKKATAEKKLLQKRKKNEDMSTVDMGIATLFGE